MDTELARTFLAVVDGGSFIAAAERLHVTQSTVSARIRTLEDRLGAALFVRNKSGATMTVAGRRFQKYATLLVRTVEHARQDIGLPAGYRASVVIGGRLALWDGLLVDWIAETRRRFPDVAVRAEVGFEAELMQGLIEGRIDLGVMYTPQRRPNLEVMHLMDERLVLVSSEGKSEEKEAGYIHVDYGPEFSAQYSARYPDFAGPALAVNVGWLGLRCLLARGGSGYFPHRLVRSLIAEGRLVPVEGAPEFGLPAYVVHPTEPHDPLVTEMRDALLEMVARHAQPG